MREARFYSLGLLLLATLVPAAPAPSSDISDLIQQLRGALARNDLGGAAIAAAKLDGVIQLQYRTFLIKDADERLAEALKWLPPGVESMLVQQEPIAVDGDNSSIALIEKPELLYTMGKLMTVDNGDLYKRLNGQMVRLAVVGMLNMHGGSGGIPGPMPDADVAYIYFLGQPVEETLFGAPVATIEAHPLWKGIPPRGAGNPQLPTVRQDTPQESEIWFTLVRSDVLVLATRREFLSKVLARVVNQGTGRALPDTLPEWANVDRKASIWGIRHYSNPGSSGDETNPLNGTEQQPPDDRHAVGVTMAFYADRDIVEIRYLSEEEAFPLRAFRQTLDEFELDGSKKGISQMKANTRVRGAFPLHVAMHLLGFGIDP
jgi:hypothetical protein